MQSNISKLDQIVCLNNFNIGAKMNLAWQRESGVERGQFVWLQTKADKIMINCF